MFIEKVKTFPSTIRRLKWTISFGVAGFLCWLLGVVFESNVIFFFFSGLLLIFCLGAAIATSLSLTKEVLVIYEAKHPQRLLNLKALFGGIVFLFFSGFSLYIAIHGYVTNQALTIIRPLQWFPRSENPQYFWISITYYAALGVCLLLIDIWIVWRLRKR